MKSHALVKLAAHSALFLLLGASAATAQIDTGSIVGTVTDKSGGVLPGITVTSTQEDTNVAMIAVTNSLGQFVFPNLKVGRYAVSAELQGFKRAVQRAIALNVQDRLEVNFTLEVGEIAEQVVVIGRSEVLQTQTAQPGGRGEELPAGHGRHYEPQGAAGLIVNDWIVNGIFSISDGRPFTITSNDRQNTGPGRLSRADCVADPVPSGFNQTIDAWFDTSAFKVPALLTYGNCGSNTVRGPGFKSMILSVFRAVPIGGRRLEFRVETFNLFNWRNWGFPGGSVSNLNTFGKITSTLGDPREMQFAIKFYF